MNEGISVFSLVGMPLVIRDVQEAKAFRIYYVGSIEQSIEFEP